MLDRNASPETGLVDQKAARHEKNTLQATSSLSETQVGEIRENRNGQFHRSFSPLQVHVSEVK